MSALGSDPPQSDCVIILGVLDIQSAAALLRCVGGDGGGGEGRGGYVSAVL